ncbi:hypothetical protein AO286_24375 [Pseudomonas syringae]|uniref:hypothetical protein n=1 Tax=Pseudomonas syringae TaxID=317 RepID=UPI000C08D7FB|nr:hypothetical protein [Pseudomonas syringae]PHN65806.1 hypothetical protein AO286_24375 [Pseudomonas syringae]
MKWARAKLPLVAQTYNEIIEDLKGLGVITSDYKTVAERNAEDEYKKLTSPRKPSFRKLLTELRESPVTSYQDLVTEDPAIPFKKLLHIFAAASMGSRTDSTKSNYSEGFRYAVKHLKEIGFSGNEDTKEYFFANYLVWCFTRNA